MTAATPTPEELARTAELRASLDRAYAIASPTGAANHLAAWANNHGKALLDLVEALRAENERLTAGATANKAAIDRVNRIEAAGRADSQREWVWLCELAMIGAGFPVAEKLSAMEARATTAEAALAASLERERVMREAARPVADAFSALSAGWMGEVPDEQRLIAPDITVGQMRQFCAALQPQETADVR